MKYPTPAAISTRTTPAITHTTRLDVACSLRCTGSMRNCSNTARLSVSGGILPFSRPRGERIRSELRDKCQKLDDLPRIARQRCSETGKVRIRASVQEPHQELREGRRREYPAQDPEHHGEQQH